MNRSDGNEIPVFTGLPAPEYMQSVLVLSARLKNKKYCVEELDERHVCQGIMIGIMTGIMLGIMLRVLRPFAVLCEDFRYLVLNR